jgi:hypothetical protein
VFEGYYMKNSRNILKPIYVMHLLQEVTLRLEEASLLKSSGFTSGIKLAEELSLARATVY